MKGLKHLCCIVLFFSFTSLFSTGQLQAQNTKIRIIKADTPLYLRADQESLEILKLSLGSEFEVIDRVGEWIRIEMPPDENGIKVMGFVHQDSAGVTGQDELEKPPPQEPKMMMITAPPEKERETSNEQNTQGLHDAIAKRDLETAKKLIAKNDGINARDEREVTPLMLAAEKGLPEIAGMLLNAGADIDAKDDDGWRALNYAAFEGQLDTAKLLIEKGSRVDPAETEIVLKRISKMFTPLMCASAAGHLNIAGLLIANGANVQIRDVSKWTALMYAARHGHYELAELLIENGADIHSKAERDWTTLMIAAMGGNIDIVNMLIEMGVGINKTCDGMDTALCIAFKNDKDDIGVFLLEKGAKQSICGTLNSTPGDNCYAFAKIHLNAARKCEAFGDVREALKHYLDASKFFEKAIPDLTKTSEKFEKGKKLNLILYFGTSLVDPIAHRKGIWTQYYDKVREVAQDAKFVTPGEQKKIEYLEKTKRSNEHLLECKKSIERLKGK